jgi:8-oxo-dGTP diphosphatase
MTTNESIDNGEAKDESIEVPLKARGAGAIFHIRDNDTFMFFLRDDKDWIPFPNMVDIIGGHLEEGESPEDAAMREFGEELEYSDTGEPFQPTGLAPFRVWVDDRNVEQNIYGCELETTPNLILKEGQRLIFLSRDELATTEFAFHYNEVVREYAESVK